MTQTSPQHRTREPGEIAVLPRVSDAAAGAALSRLCLDNLGIDDLGIDDLANVVPFRRLKTTQGDAPPCIVDPATRPIPPAPIARSHRFTLALAATILMHGAAFAAFFFYEPPPLASIGVEAVSVEIVLGTNSTTGINNPQSQDIVDSRFAPKEDKVADDNKPEENLNAPEKPVEKPLELAAVDPAPQPPVEQPKAIAAPAEPQVQSEPQQVQPQPQEQPAIVLAPDALPTLTEPPKETAVKPVEAPAETKPVETKPVETKPVEIKRETPKPVAKKPDAKPEPKKPEVRREAATKKRGEAERTRVASAPAASEEHVSGKGVGAGRSDSQSNYKGILYAHLMRFLERLDEQAAGPAWVEFTVSASGSLVSSRLATSSGNARLDALAMSMVRRASPYPAPGPNDIRVSRVPIRANR